MKSKELCQSLEKAKERFKEALSFPDTDPMRDALIQRFEYNFELAWKLMNSILSDEGIGKTGVRTIIRTAAQLGLIDNPAQWLIYADARNRTSHMYIESVAIDVAKIARLSFLQDLESLLNQSKQYVD